MDMEKWKDIKDYEGIYQVSNLARIKRCMNVCKDIRGRLRIKSEVILKPYLQNKGRALVTLSKNGKTKKYLVYRLMACEFIPNPNNYPCVMHMDDDPTNNDISNLKWGTQKDNMQDMHAKNRWRNQFR
jgi:hypothetical protein